MTAAESEASTRHSDPPQVVWRWWHGEVVALPEPGRATLRRNVTQPTPDASRTGSMDAALPPELAGTVAAGDTVWFGLDGDDNGKVVVATAGPEPDLAGVVERVRRHQS